jgi:hypothetical protein
MPIYYTVVHAVPDPVAGEFANIGVVVFGDGEVRTRFLRQWGRVEAFAREDISYLQDFAQEFEREAAATLANVRQQPLDPFAAPPTVEEDELRRMAAAWSNAIQFSPIEVAEGDPDLLLVELADIFLKEETQRPRGYRDTGVAARAAEGWLRSAFERRLGQSRTKNVIWGRRELPGKKYDHNKIDAAVVNGRIYHVARGLSFEIQSRDRLETQVSQTILQLGDLRDRYDDLALSIVTLLPPDLERLPRFARDLYRDTQTSSSRIDAQLVEEARGEAWAEGVASTVIPQIEHRPATGAPGEPGWSEPSPVPAFMEGEE